jgi:HK97 family phage portal protein
MGIFQTIFGKRQPGNRSASGFTPWEAIRQLIGNWDTYPELQQSDTAQMCIDRIATHASKLEPVHVRKKTPVDMSYIQALLERPNEYMCWQQFAYKIVSILYYKDNAWIYPQYTIDANGAKVYTGFYPLDPLYTELVRLPNSNELWVRFNFNGYREAVPYSEVIHLRRHYIQDDLQGGSDNRCIIDAINVYQEARKGIANAVKVSCQILGLVKVPKVLSPDDIKRNMERMTQYIENLKNTGGFLPTDINGDVVPLNLDPKIASKDSIDALKENVLEWFGVNKKVAACEYDEAAFNAFYETVIEPLALQLSQEFTRVLFSAREYSFGNRILFVANRLMFASWDVKLKYIQACGPLGVITKGKIAEILGLPPPPDADKYLQTLNVVDASKANEYQGVSSKEEDEDAQKQS